MGIRENKVERYLDAEVMKAGGMTRKWVSPGVVGVPDRIVILKGAIWFVEVKAIDGTTTSWQDREIKRLRDHGANVDVVYGQVAVDELMKRIRDSV